MNERIPVGDRIVIYPRGKRRTWTADFSVNGRHHRASLKTRNKKTAIQRAVQLDADLMDGKFKKRRAVATIASAIEAYIEYLQTEGRARKTIARYRGELYALRDFAKGQHALRLTDVTPGLLDRFRASRKDSHAVRTLYLQAVIAKQFLKWCVSRDLLGENPLQNYRVEKPIREPKGGPGLEQVRQILAASTPRRRLLLAALAFTGMRSGELQRLRKEDVDLENGWIHIMSREGAETKTRRSRKVPIHPSLGELLGGHRQPPGPWFFAAEPSPTYPAGDHWISPTKLNEEFMGTAGRLKLPVGRATGGFTLHSLRHFFETFCVNAGIPQRVIDNWLGHQSDQSMAAVYYRLRDEESQAFMRKVPFGDGAPAADAGEKEEE